jgi:hypothetical protein
MLHHCSILAVDVHVHVQAGGQPGQKWVALPQWKALSLARHPVAIPLLNCAENPAVLAASRAKVKGHAVAHITGLPSARQQLQFR